MNIGFLSAQNSISQEAKDRFEELLVSDFLRCEGLDKNTTLEQRIDLTHQLLKNSPFVFEGLGVSAEMKIVGDEIFEFNKIKVLSTFKGRIRGDTVVIVTRASGMYHIVDGEIEYREGMIICYACSKLRIRYIDKHIFTCKLDDYVNEKIVGDYTYFNLFKERNYTYLTSKRLIGREGFSYLWRGFYGFAFWSKEEMLDFLKTVEDLNYKQRN